MKHEVRIPSYRRRRAWGGVAASALSVSGLLGAPTSAQSLEDGLLWSSSAMAGESWKPSSVAIGNHGTQVFSQLSSFDTYAKLFSAHDSGTPPAIWTHIDPAYSTTASADSAVVDDLHVGMYQRFLSGTSGPQEARVDAYRSDSSTADWTYPLPLTITNHTISKVHVSQDGATVVAYAHDSGVQQLKVAVLKPLSAAFDPDDPEPAQYSSLPSGYSLKGSDLSADGSRLVLSYSSYLKVYDTGSGNVVFTQTAGAGAGVTEAVAVSGDGKYFARGKSQGFQVYRRVGTSNDYALLFEHTIAPLSSCTAVDLSDDGSTVVAGFVLYDDFSVRVMAIDVSSQGVMADKSFDGNGSLSNKVADIATSADGAYFVAGFWGDGSASLPELVSFRSASSNPIGVYDQPGSVVDVDMTCDGRRFAVAARDHHVSVGGASGRIQCYNTVDRDMGLDGVPSVDSSVTFAWRNPIGASYAILLRARHLAPAPTSLPGVFGSLYLPRGEVAFLPGSVEPNGIAHRAYYIPGTHDMIGTSFYFQGYGGSPRTLTQDWIKLTVLP